MLEVYAPDHPVTFSYDPVTVTGALELVYDDPENNAFYRLKKATAKIE